MVDSRLSHRLTELLARVNVVFVVVAFRLRPDLVADAQVLAAVFVDSKV